MKQFPQIAVSAGNSKLGAAIPNVSLIPIKDCGNCEQCRTDCYALKAWRQYKPTRAAWTRNSKAFRADPVAACQQIHDWLAKKRKRPEFFRIHVAGDFLNQSAVNAWSNLAADNADIKFLAFTKMHALDYSTIASNMTVVHSMWPGLADTAPNGASRAWLQDGTETRIPQDAIHCPGNCADCGMCWELPSIGRDVYFTIH